MKKVLHFIDSGGVYGAERVILNLSRQLKNSGDFTPVVGCIVGHPSDQNDLFDASRDLGIAALKIQIRNHLLPYDLPRAASQMKGDDIDLIHSHGYKPSVFARAIRAMTDITTLATCHLWFQPENAPMKTRVMIALERRFYRRFPAVVAVSEPIQRVLIQSGVPLTSTHIIENGVEIRPPSVNPEMRQVIRANLGIDPDVFCVLNTARLTKQKAQWLLVDAARLLKDKGLRFEVLVVGEGELKESLQRSIAEQGVGGQVRLLGFRSDIAELLAASDAFALPSLDEGMPMSLLEAVAANVPTIVTPVGDIPRLITDMESGLVIPLQNPVALASAVESLATSPELCRSLAQVASKRMAKVYSSAAMAAKYTELYRKLLDVNGRE